MVAFTSMSDFASAPVAVQVEPNRFAITQQLATPETHRWSDAKGEATWSLDVCRLGTNNWIELGSISNGVAFSIPPEAGPVPLFRTRDGDRPTYIGLRRIELPGTSNFRDIGGYLTSGNSQVKFGKIFRSDNLAKLTKESWDLISQLGIGSIIDLRREDEKRRAPTVVPSDVPIEVIEIPIDGEILGRTELLVHIFSREVKKVTDDDMAQMYQDILYKFRDKLQTTVSALLDPTTPGKIVHCTAGKDRTGLSIALIQMLCGVTDDDVKSDFLLSNSFRTPARIASLSEKLRSHSVNIEDIAPYLGASPVALRRAMAIVRGDFGGARQYLGFSDAQEALLNSELLIY